MEEEDDKVKKEHCAFKVFYWLFLIYYSFLLVVSVLIQYISNEDYSSNHIIVLTLVLPLHLTIQVLRPFVIYFSG